MVPDGEINRYITVVAEDVLAGPPRHFLSVRDALVSNQPEVNIPSNYFDFFASYAESVASTSKLIRSMLPLVMNIKPKKPMCVMYSGGSESKVMDYSFSSVDCVTITNFLPSPIKREFQIALIGAVLGYSVSMIGVAPYDNQDAIGEQFEFSETFVELWNLYFPQTTIQYPLGLLWKDDIYRLLYEEQEFYLEKNVTNFTYCEAADAPCGKCWKCAEVYFTLEALKLPTNKMDPASLIGFKVENSRLYENNEDPYHAMAYFTRLTEKYGYTGWRLS